MKTVSIKELHEATGKWVRRAAKEDVIITDHGQQVALLNALKENQGVPFPRIRLEELPKSMADSTVGISAERDDQ